MMMRGVFLLGFFMWIIGANTFEAMAAVFSADRHENEKWSLEYMEQPHVEWKNDSLTLMFSSRLSGEIKDAYSVYYVPVYKSRGDSLNFPEMGFFTRRGMKFMQRRDFFSRHQRVRQVSIKGKKDMAFLRYRETLSVPKSWLGGELTLKIYCQDCCSDDLYAIDTIIVPKQGLHPLLDKQELESKVAHIDREPCDRQERLVFFYPVDQDEITPMFADNDTAFHKLEKLLMPLLVDTLFYRIKQLEVKGYASPEATFEHNLRLAEQRAACFRDYLQRNYPLQKYKVRIIGCGEDWEGLYKMLMEDTSNQPYKAEILEIIDCYGIFEGREQKLMDLKKGVPYRRLMKDNFPLLRRIELIIDYEIKPCNE